MNHSFILESLAEQGLISEDAVGEVAFEIAQTGLSLAKVLEKQNLMTEDQFHLTIAQMIGTEAVSLNGFVPPQELLDMLPVGLAQLHRAVPVGWDGNALQVALD
ncbi:MAG: pilus assembly protein PilB, partial [Chthoniobacteraceae bacterium]|nr:pilus assembly protein PilB [Chthoniobacteraceae bacterium]